jgi:hypothetical protein
MNAAHVVTVLQRERSAYFACGVSFALSLFFIFVWAPHPWGWEGFDHYYEISRLLASGQPFPTTDVPWGYAYFLAAFYRAFGDHPAIPLLAQAALNALVPLLVYAYARQEFDARVAGVAALLTGFFSFNTVYSSTQSSDAVCTVIFMAAVASFARGRRRDESLWIVLSGVLIGLASQFRPNLLLVPLVLAVFHVVAGRPAKGRRVWQAVALVVAAAAVLAPWTVRNYRLTGQFIPTSTHGGVQLWYGTLQTGPYLQSRAYNPRAVFESATFAYTSLDRVPLLVSARANKCGPLMSQPLELVYWTDRDAARVRSRATSAADGAVSATMRPAPSPTTYYYYFEYFEAGSPDRPAPRVVRMPRDGEAAPLVYFISDDHLGDLDRHGDLLDIFDLARMLRQVAWRDPLPFADRLDFDHDGQITGLDISLAGRALAGAAAGARGPTDSVRAVEVGASAVTLWFVDGSTLVVPRAWSGRVTDLVVRGPIAESILHATISFAAIRQAQPSSSVTGQPACDALEDVAVNKVYFRDEPHTLRRYTALAFDNIRRDPRAYAASVLYRALRIFVVVGTSDARTAQQFHRSSVVYGTATVASLVIFVVLLAGVWIAWRRGYAVALPALLIAYVPATLSFVLTNMRYSVTVQPLAFVFIATAILSAIETVEAPSARTD